MEKYVYSHSLSSNVSNKSVACLTCILVCVCVCVLGEIQGHKYIYHYARATRHLTFVVLVVLVLYASAEVVSSILTKVGFVFFFQDISRLLFWLFCFYMLVRKS